MVCPPLEKPPIVNDWLTRHSHPWNLMFHLIGIPLNLVGFFLLPVAVWLMSPGILMFAFASFVVGYLFQFAGHAFDRSMPGELRGLQNWMRKREMKKKFTSENAMANSLGSAGKT
jgi:uncharacterized membrane protein YGL010W